MQLSPEQQAAVERSGQDACCVAGPGSGKTRVLVERFAWLASHTARPEAILAITFTEKAAQEIKSRLVARFEKSPGMRARIERAHVSTIDGFCRSILNEHALEAGIDPAFRVLDEYEARFELMRSIEAALNRYSAEHTIEFRALAERWAADDYAQEIYSIFSTLRLNGGAARSVSTLPGYDAAPEIREIEQSLRAGVAQAIAANEKQQRIVDACREWLANATRDPLMRLWALVNDKTNFALSTAKGMKPLSEALRAAREQAASAMASVAGAQNADALATLAQILVECEREYAARKRTLGALDFGDLEERALALLESNTAIRKTVSERFDAMLMDELQDTNPLQWSIVNAVRREGRFFAVGDINQSIYGWRGARPEQFEEYQRAIAARGWQVDSLADNYRSRPELIDAVMRVCEQGLAGIRAHTLNAKRDSSNEPAIEVIRAEDDAEEARWVAHRILELGRDDAKLRFSEIAILARGAGVFDDYEAALRNAGIPVSVQRGRNFFDEPEIVDLLNVLRVIVNPTNGPALLGLLRSPLLRVTDGEIRARHEAALPLAPERAQEQIEALRAEREETPADIILQRFLDATGRWAELLAGQRANVRKLYRILRSIAAVRPRTLEETIAELDALRATGRENNAAVAGAEDAVQLLTIHAAKGLEFPIVFIAAMHKKSGAGQTSRIALSRERGLGACWHVAGMDSRQADGALQAAASEEDARSTHEEDRLLYVAMTRAEQRLIFVWSDRRSSSPRWTAPVTAALGLEWNVEINAPTIVNGARVLRAQGAPPAFEFSTSERKESASVALLDALKMEHTVPAMVTATTLAHFAECPRRYALRTLLAWPEPQETAPALPAEGSEPSQAASGAAFGDAVHRLLAGETVDDAPDDARELAAAFLDGELGQRATRATRIGRETPVLYEFEGLLIQGVIDLWFVENGELVVVDYKTDRAVNAERFAAYSNQLRFYALALSRALNVNRTVAFLALLRQRRAVAVSLPETALEELRALVSGFTETHRNGEFPARPGVRCMYCAYARGVCPDAAIQLVSDPLLPDDTGSRPL